MAATEKKTFYLYSKGFPPQQLRLGHIVFGDYSAPVAEPLRHYAVDPSGELDVEEWTYSQPLGTCYFSTKRPFGFGLNIPALELLQLFFSFGGSREQAVAGKRGRIVTIKDPERLFKEKILGSDAAREKLQRWLSLAKTDYILHTVGFRTPKIWLLTGFIELEDAISSASATSDNSVELGVSQELVAALTTIPIGASVKTSSGNTTTGILEALGKNIWAAQFQRLDAKYIKFDPKKPPSPLTIQLMFRPTYPLNAVLSGDDDDGVDVGLCNPEPIGENGEIAEDQKYWQEMTEAEERWDEDE